LAEFLVSEGCEEFTRSIWGLINNGISQAFISELYC